MHLGPLTDLYGTPGAPKRARFGPEWPFWGPRRSSDGPGGPDLVPTAPDWPVWVRLILTTHFDLVKPVMKVLTPYKKLSISTGNTR